jgi:hypothetical protein
MIGNLAASKLLLGASLVVIGGVTIAIQIQRDLSQANAEILAAQVQAPQQVGQASLPELPVTVGFRMSMLGDGMVAEFVSHIAGGVAVEADVDASATHQTRAFIIDLSPERRVEIGRYQGYAFAPGDVITLKHAGFKPIRVTAPSS